MALPEPSDRERRAITEAATRRIARRPRVGARLVPKGDDCSVIKPDHSDAVGWSTRMLDAMGTPSPGFACNDDIASGSWALYGYK